MLLRVLPPCESQRFGNIGSSQPHPTGPQQLMWPTAHQPTATNHVCNTPHQHSTADGAPSSQHSGAPHLSAQAQLHSASMACAAGGGCCHPHANLKWYSSMVVYTCASLMRACIACSTWPLLNCPDSLLCTCVSSRQQQHGSSATAPSPQAPHQHTRGYSHSKPDLLTPQHVCPSILTRITRCSNLPAL